MARMANYQPFVDSLGRSHGFLEPLNAAASRNSPMIFTNSVSYKSDIVSVGDWKSNKSHLSTSMSSRHYSRRSFASSMTESVHSRANSSDYNPYHTGCIFNHLTIPVNQQAACFFLSNFVIVPHYGVLRGYLNFIIPFVGSDQPSQAVKAAFSAVALAALATRPNSRSLLSDADAAYYVALKEINATMKDTKVATNYTTLAAILMLSTFEVRILFRPHPRSKANTLIANYDTA